MSWIALDWTTKILFWGSIVCNLYWIVRNVRECMHYNRARIAHEAATNHLHNVNVLHRRLCQLERKWFNSVVIGKNEVTEFYHDEILKLNDELEKASQKKYET